MPSHFFGNGIEQLGAFIIVGRHGGRPSRSQLDGFASVIFPMIDTMSKPPTIPNGAMK